jgi:hypothetical protein
MTSAGSNPANFRKFSSMQPQEKPLKGAKTSTPGDISVGVAVQKYLKKNLVRLQILN